MAEQSPAPGGIYRLTSIGRPVDPRYPSNRALLIILPVLAIIAVALRGIAGLDGGVAAVALQALLVGFASWALTRELAPDDNAAAFVALALAFCAFVVFNAGSVLLLFVALFHARIVNRSTGMAARAFDTIAVLGLSTWAAISLGQPLLLLLAAAAFALDASLREPLKHHYFAAAVCLGAFGWLLVDGASPLAGSPGSTDWLVAAAIAAALGLVIRFGEAPRSVCDVYSRPLDRVRVNAGLVLGFLVAFQALLSDGRAAWFETPIWACLVAVPASFFVRRSLQ